MSIDTGRFRPCGLTYCVNWIAISPSRRVDHLQPPGDGRSLALVDPLADQVAPTLARDGAAIGAAAAPQVKLLRPLFVHRLPFLQSSGSIGETKSVTMGRNQFLRRP